MLQIYINNHCMTLPTKCSFQIDFDIKYIWDIACVVKQLIFLNEWVTFGRFSFGNILLYADSDNDFGNSTYSRKEYIFDVCSNEKESMHLAL